MADIAEKTIQTGEITTHYWEVGQGNPIILIHGGGAGADAWGNWGHIMGTFAEGGFRTFAIDMVGYGFNKTGLEGICL